MRFPLLVWTMVACCACGGGLAGSDAAISDAASKAEDAGPRLLDGSVATNDAGASACESGAVTSKCACGSTIVSSGYCCGGAVRPSDCMRVRLDCGLASGTSTFDGKVFSPMLPYLTAGQAYDSDEGIVKDYPITNTDYDALYQNETWVDTSAPATFTVPIDNGNYTVHLHFVDWSQSAPGERLFHVDLQGGRVLTDLDIISEVGKSAALVKSFDVAVTNGAITLTFTNDVFYAEIAAVEILPQGEPHLPTTGPAGNHPPTVHAGTDQTIQLPTTSVTLTGTASDPDGDPLTYAWTKTSGGAATIANPTAASTQVTDLAVGSYAFTLTADDGRGGTASDAVLVTVSAAGNHPPTVNAGTDQTIQLPTNSVTLTGTASDPDGDPLTYSWTKTSGPAATIANPTAASTQVTGLVAGSYAFTLTVNDGQGGTAQDGVQVDVMATGGPAYYFSTSQGDDSRSSTEAKSPATPWKTLAKLTSIFASLNPGDSVLLRRGEVYPGSVVISKSGASGAPITVGAYGSGAKPVITGFKTVTNWAPAGNGVFERIDSEFGSAVNMVTVDGAFQAIGRWPKVTDANGGYLTVDSTSSADSLTSSGLSGAPSFVGGELVYRPEHWILNRRTVTGQTSSTVTFNQTSAQYPPRTGWGFFFQNHVNALTALGDWAYVPSQQRLQMHFGADDPASHAVKASVVDLLISLPDDGTAYITFDGLALTGANSNAINASGAGDHHVQINNCDISYTGVDAIWVGDESSHDNTISNSTISFTNNTGIRAGSATSWLIQGNVISNNAMVAGMGLSEDEQYNAIDHVGSGSLVEGNEVGYTGYLGVNYWGSGDNITIQNNYFHHFCMVKDDCGAIYTYAGYDASTSGTNRKVLNNVLLYGGSPAVEYGTDGALSSNGIYVDGAAANIEISGNTVAFMGGAGILFNDASHLDIQDNTLFANDTGFNYAANFPGQLTINNITQTNNTFFAKEATQRIGDILINSGDSLSNWGSWDDNYYCRPILEPQGIIGDYYDTKGIITIGIAGDYHHYSLDTWVTVSGQDAHSQKSPKTITDVNDIRFEYNASGSPTTVTLDGNYIDVKSAPYQGTVTLAPWSSVVLLKD